MSDKISLEKMADVIAKGLKEYGEIASDELKASVKEASKTALSEVKKKAPKKTGEYAKGWTKKVTMEDSSRIKITVYASKKSFLTHLLENGHVKRGGGRTKAYPHISAAEKKAEEILELDLKRRLRE